MAIQNNRRDIAGKVPLMNVEKEWLLVVEGNWVKIKFGNKIFQLLAKGIGCGIICVGDISKTICDFSQVLSDNFTINQCRIIAFGYQIEESARFHYFRTEMKGEWRN